MAAATPGALDPRPVSSRSRTHDHDQDHDQANIRAPADHAPASANSISAPSHPQEQQDQERPEQPKRQKRPDQLDQLDQLDQPPASLAYSISDLTASAYPRLEQSQSRPYTSVSAAVSTSSSPGPASPSAGTSSGFHSGGLVSRSPSAPRVRRPSTQDRINGILETARQRAETVSAQASAQASASNSANPTPHNSLARHATFRMEPLLRNQSAPGTFQAESDGDDGRRTPEQRLGDGQGSQRSARHLHYAANTGTYGTLGTSASRSSSGRPRSRKNADRGYQQEAAASGAAVTSGAPSRAASRAASIAGGPPADLPWWKDVLSGFQSIELENKGSVARDHLALERTFLAWLRTSLAFASIGIAVTQLFRLNTSASSGNNETEEKLSRLRHIGRPLGSTFLGISVLILFLGYHRFYQSQQWILKGKFPASRGTILLVSLMAFALMVTSLVIVVVVQPSEG
ncbi:hypothetical protein F503_000010 [Ophiostoma piceae UAMH 11346]|uniref:DUF202 domain-containing protein n=1 Tax=Ophiostoma piceae (strain UAMH 11346) TaxID=1262450 RepID=S3BZH3_OPHP1|nr:hypothetical protein F503_000010 [Ophiostoma piceae UAMH 11346]